MTEEFSLKTEEKKFLLELARKTLEAYARSGRGVSLPRETELGPNLKSRCGAFVSLHKLGELRGCIGIFEGRGALYETIGEMAVSAGWQDPRFPPLAERELKDLEIEISVLTPLRPARAEEVQVGKHGIYITRGHCHGVLLPQVATEYGWDRETFLEHTCLKAGLPPEAWKEPGTKIEIFSAEVFNEKDFE